MKISKGAKIGIMIQIITFIIMILLVLFNKTIPSILSWTFFAGLVIAMTDTLNALSKMRIRR